MTDRDIESPVAAKPIELAPAPLRRRTRVQQRRRSAAALIVVVAILGGIGIVAVKAGRTVFGGLGTPSDFKGDGKEAVTVVVPAGASAVQIGEILRTKGVVRSVGAFTESARADTRAKLIRPGSYRLKRQMSADAALALLLDPASRVVGKVTIPEGLTLKEILLRISQKSKIPLADLQAAAAKPKTLGLPSYAEGRLEGFLFPATYDILPDDTATAVLTTMVNRFEQEAISVELVEKAKALNLTPLQAVIVASMIEREAKFEEEGPRIATVIYNRLKRKQPLQIDATVQYLLPKQKERLLNTDLKVKSPYNTYLNAGLPPGAISSPGTTSLLATLAPEEGEWRWYVVTDKDGHHEFATTEAEFLRLKAKGKAATAK